MPRFQSSELYRIISDNLSLLNQEFTSVEERRLAHLCDRAALLARDSELLTSEDRCERFGQIFSKRKTVGGGDSTVGRVYRRLSSGTAYPRQARGMRIFI